MTTASSSVAPTKVAILGGGPGGIATAFWLTSPQLQGRFDVTVYTLGWRLGGKCASGRNQDISYRIQEHGLHILMGCYRNAFDTIRNCYAEWKPRADGPFQTWRDAFTPEWQITLEAPAPDGPPPSWAAWNFVFPALPGEPGDPLSSSMAAVPAALAGPSPEPLERHVVTFAYWLEDHITQYVPTELLGGVDHHDALAKFRDALSAPPTAGLANVVEEKLQLLAKGIREAIVTSASSSAAVQPATIPSPVQASPSGAFICPFQCKLILAEIGLGVAFGWTRDLVFGGKTLDDLDAQDFRQWLRSCLVSEEALASPPIRALYDLTFAFRNGDASSIDNGSMAAGVTLRFALEASVGYKGAPLWRMNAGMGDTVFTPLYQVLKARGASIKFFHRLDSIALTPDNSRIGTVDLAEQASIIAGDYDPFVVVQGLDCWPSQPNWCQLVDGADLQARGVDFESSSDITVAQNVELKLGVDFDVVVLAVPPDVIKTVTPGLTGQKATWDAMLANSASVATEAFQLWLKPDLSGLGWTLGPTVLTSFAEPFDSWADMSFLLPREAWSASNPPYSIEYFCGCLKESNDPPDPQQDAQTWLAQSISTLWPSAAPPNGPIDPGLVISAYYRANYQGFERYVQTPAGSVQFRLSSSAPVFGNLYLAGDWTLTRFSGGCFESAVESGMLAAAAIAQ